MFHPDLSCSNCGKTCDTDADWRSMFDNNLCSLCEAAMFEDMGRQTECADCGGVMPCVSFVCLK